MLAKTASLGYPVADLFLLLALLRVLLRPLRTVEDRPSSAHRSSVACLIVADVGAILLTLHPATSTGRTVPHFFWLAADLLIPLAAIVQVRVVQRQGLGVPPVPESQDRQGHDAEDVRAVLRLFLPLVAALLASSAILPRAAMTRLAGADRRSIAAPLAVSSGLLLLVIVRQAVTFLEMNRLRAPSWPRRPAAGARRARSAQGQVPERGQPRDAHPLTTMEMFFGLVARRPDSPPPRGALAYSQRSVSVSPGSPTISWTTRTPARPPHPAPGTMRPGHHRACGHRGQRAAEPTRTILLHPTAGSEPCRSAPTPSGSARWSPTT